MSRPCSGLMGICEVRKTTLSPTFTGKQRGVRFPGAQPLRGGPLAPDPELPGPRLPARITFTHDLDQGRKKPD